MEVIHIVTMAKRFAHCSFPSRDDKRKGENSDIRVLRLAKSYIFKSKGNHFLIHK